MTQTDKNLQQKKKKKPNNDWKNNKSRKNKQINSFD